jgi:transposase
MLGAKTRRFTLLPAVTLEEMVPADHFYRHLDRVLDLSFVRDLVQNCYAADMGRPSVDPVVFFKLQLVMFFEGIRSERQLLRVAADRLSVRWYLGYNLDEALPDHSSLTRIRARYGLEVFRRFFEAIVEQCQQAGLVWGQELYFDATHVLADAAMDSLTARFAAEAREALHAHLTALFPDKTARPAHDAAHEETGEPTVTAPGPRAPTREGMSLPPTFLPVDLPDPMREDLAEANATRHDWIAQEGRQQREVRGVYQRIADLRISSTDPDATPMRLKGGGTHLGYQTHDVVDGGKRRIIVGVLVGSGEVMENQPMLDLLWRARFRWRLRGRQVTGDTTYGTIPNIRAVEDMGIRAYVPLPDWEQHSPYFGAAKFTYDAAQDHYVCPNGQVIRRTHTDEAGQRVLYRAPAATCRTCPLKAHCTPATKTVARSTAPSVRSTLNGCKPTSRLRPIRRRCASARSGSSRCLLKPRTGMGCGASACANCGG